MKGRRAEREKGKRFKERKRMEREFQILIETAENLLLRGESEKARENCERALKLVRKGSLERLICLYEIGATFYQQARDPRGEIGFYLKAIEYFEQVRTGIRRRYNWQSLRSNKIAQRLAVKDFYYLGTSYFFLERYDKAIKAFELLLSVDPNSQEAQEARIRIAQCLIHKDPSEARKAIEILNSLLERGISHKHLLVISWALLGQAYSLTEQLEKAEKALREAERIAIKVKGQAEEVFSRIHFYLSDVYFVQGRLNEALRYIQQAEKEELKNLGYQRREEFFQAVEKGEIRKRFTRNLGNFYHLWIRILVRLHLFEEAREKMKYFQGCDVSEEARKEIEDLIEKTRWIFTPTRETPPEERLIKAILAVESQKHLRRIGKALNKVLKEKKEEVLMKIIPEVSEMRKKLEMLKDRGEIERLRETKEDFAEKITAKFPGLENRKEEILEYLFELEKKY